MGGVFRGAGGGKTACGGALNRFRKTPRQPRCGLGAIQALFATKTRTQECMGKPLKGAGLSRVWVSAWSERVPPCRLLLSNQEQIQGPKNGSVARFSGLGCYQKSSGFSWLLRAAFSFQFPGRAINHQGPNLKPGGAKTRLKGHNQKIRIARRSAGAHQGLAARACRSARDTGAGQPLVCRCRALSLPGRHCLARHQIENFFAKRKQYRAIATRNDQTARNLLAPSIWQRLPYGSPDG